VIWGVIDSVCINILQGETERPRATVIRVKDNEVDYLPGLQALRLGVPVHSDMLPRHQPYVGHLNRM